MKKLKIILIAIAVVFIALLIGKIMQPKPVVNSTPTPTINITYANFASELSKNSMVKAVPDDATMLLKFYNFNSGERKWEKSYVIKRGKVTEGEEEAEIILSLSSKYLAGLTNKNFCSVIQRANKNGDLVFETSLSKASLAWKFKGMLKYKECLGF